jgi:serine protease Do
MNQKSESDRQESIPLARHTRVVLILVALCCLSMGIAIGAVVHGIAGAKSDDNRLAINNARLAPDTLSASFSRVAEQVEPSVAHIKVYESEVYQREGTGSGVIINPAGYILTNSHVVSRAIKIRVKLADGSESDAKVIGIDVPTDLAVIKIEANKSLPVARMGDSDKLDVGDWVIAIGSPFGLEQTVTAGIISAKDRVTESGSTPFQQFLQTDAAINPGNSGGPLVNLSGEVIGINTQIATNTGVYNGIGFALPSSTAVEIYNQLIAHGRVRRGFLGINPQEITPQVARLNKIADGLGVVVREVTSDASPAARAGLKSGDVIVSINDQKVKSSRDLIRRIAALPVGSTASIGYVRAGEQHTAAVKLEERVEDSREQPELKPPPFDPRNPRGLNDKSERAKPKPTLGINVRNLTPEIARLRGLEGARGALVAGFDAGSLAEDNGVTEDDLIVEVNNRPVTSAEDFQRIVRDLKSGDDVVIRVLRKERGTLHKAWIISFSMP